MSFSRAPHRLLLARGLRARTHQPSGAPNLLSCFVTSTSCLAVSTAGDARQSRWPLPETSEWTILASRRPDESAVHQARTRSGSPPQKEIIAMQTAKFDTRDTDPPR